MVPVANADELCTDHFLSCGPGTVLGFFTCDGKKNQYLFIALSLSTCPKGSVPLCWSLKLCLQNRNAVQKKGTSSGWSDAPAGKDCVSCGAEFSKEVRKRSRVRGIGGASKNTDLRYLGSLEKEKRDVWWGVGVGSVARRQQWGLVVRKVLEDIVAY